MSETTLSTPEIVKGSVAAAPSGDPWQAARALVEQLENSGAAHVDPMKFHFLKSLLRRSLNHPPSIAQTLQSRVIALAADLQVRMAQHLNSIRPEPSPIRSSPLSDLMSYLKERVEASDIGENAAEPAHHHPELKSVRRFRESLRRRQSEKAVARAVAERPENPGPLNPQMLMIRSLALLRDLSPAYVNRFVTYTESLLWLEDTHSTEEPAKAFRPAPPPKRR